MHQHKTYLIVTCKIEVADSWEPKRSGSNSESSYSLPTLGTIILASFRVLNDQKPSILIGINLRHVEQNHLIHATNIDPTILIVHPICDIDA